MNFKKWVKSIQTAGYNGARTVFVVFQDGDNFSKAFAGAQVHISHMHESNYRVVMLKKLVKSQLCKLTSFLNGKAF